MNRKTPGLVLHDFYARWCVQCDMQRATLEQVAASQHGMRMERIDIEAHPAIARRFGVTEVPTLVFVRGGQVLEKLVGAQPSERIAAAVRRQLNNERGRE